MRGIFIFFLFFCFINFYAIAQDDDYVIDKPAEPKNKVFNTIPNPDFTSYLLSSSAYTLKSRDMRFSNTDILYAKGSYGITNNTMASLSISLVGTFIGSVKQQININDEVMLGMSASIGQLFYKKKDPSDTNSVQDTVVFFAGGQSMVTLGDIQNNITFGAGFYYVKSTVDMIHEEREFFLSNIYVALQKQIGRKVYLMAEGIYCWNYNVVTGAAGIKIIIKEHMSLGLGVMPLAWIGPRINRSTSVARANRAATAIPLITFRLILDRH